ncbi:major facilitator superfamily domain-containing protein [Geopyxis carbonaria]|nr:major facilitator superfamily domain-containing protein [Geopyxis carbonaria]
MSENTEKAPNNTAPMVAKEPILRSVDPLRWSTKKKHAVLAAICYMTLMTDFLAGYGVPMTVPQAKDWKLSTVDAGRSLSGNTFTQGFGSLLAVPFAMRFGTLPVMFWSTFMTWIMTMTCAVTPGWIGYIAVRVVQGFFSAAGQVVGLTIIQDIFYFEDHARKVGIWGWSILIGPYFGPFLSSFILRSLTWRESWWLISGFVFIGLVLVMFALDETAYDREIPENNPPRPQGYLAYKIHSLSGVMGYRAKGRPTFGQGAMDLVHVFMRPQFLCLFLYHGITYMWSVGINGTLINFLVPKKPLGYGFDTVAIGLMYFSPMIAVIVGELFGHFFNDAVQKRSISRGKGFFEPEARLWCIYFSTVFMPLGLILLGFSLHNLWHWFAVALFWGIFIFAAMTSTVAITAYVLDCFPNHSAAASALLNFTRVLFGFLVPWFQSPWAKKVGVQWSFTTQGLICLAVFPIIPVVQYYGKQWRQATDMSPDVIKADHYSEHSVETEMGSIHH